MKCKGAWKHKLLACITAAVMVFGSLSVPALDVNAEETEDVVIDVVGEEDPVADAAEEPESEDITEDAVEEEISAENAGERLITYGTPDYTDSGKYNLKKLELASSVDQINNIVITVSSGTVDTAIANLDTLKVYRSDDKKKLAICYSTKMSHDGIQKILRDDIDFTVEPGKKQVVKIKLGKEKNNILDKMSEVGLKSLELDGKVHYYAHVKSGQLSWENAYNAAKKFRYLGMQGYLITLP